MAVTKAVRLWAVLLAFGVVAAACSGGEEAATTTSTATTSSTTTTSTITTTTTVPPTTTTTVLPGEPFDLAPAAGALVGVVGVSSAGELNVRAAPGTDQVILTTLPPLAEVPATGRAQILPSSTWYEITTDGVTGWSSIAFLAYVGATDDITAEVVEDLGSLPIAETMLELGQIVAESQASTEPASRIVASVAPSVGDLGEVTFDVVGLGDDALRGVRLHIFGAPDPGGEAFSLMSVEQTLLCGRGVTDDGVCV